MGTNSLEQTIDTIIVKTTDKAMSNLKTSYSESLQVLDNSISRLEQEYDKIIAEGNKEADKIKKQIIGSSDLEARNKQLVALEQAVDNVFEKALEEIANTDRSDDYEELIKTLLNESINVLGTAEVVVFTNSKDNNIVQSILSQFSGAELSSEQIDCLGGVVVKSKDDTMKFDNTIDARIERLKPLIRKEIASIFGVR